MAIIKKTKNVPMNNSSLKVTGMARTKMTTGVGLPPAKAKKRGGDGYMAMMSPKLKSKVVK